MGCLAQVPQLFEPFGDVFLAAASHDPTAQSRLPMADSVNVTGFAANQPLSSMSAITSPSM